MEPKAVEKYLEIVETATAAAERIYQFLDDFGEIGPNDVDWGHVEEIAYIANKLKDVRDRIDGTGEYADD